MNNFRDVGGANDQGAYRTSSGRKMRRGVVYRSNALAPAPPDLATLDTLDIRADYDLRTTGEIARLPDIPPTGASYLNINIEGVSDNPTPVLTSGAECTAAMEDLYREFVTDRGIRSRFAELLQRLATTNGSQVYHCSGGKDRTGWATTILLSVLGVPQNVIVYDYLLTNSYSEASIQASYQQMVIARGQAFADTYYPGLIADQRYLYAGWNQVVSSYGTMANYINQGLGLSSTVQTELRDRLLA